MSVTSDCESVIEIFANFFYFIKVCQLKKNCKILFWLFFPNLSEAEFLSSLKTKKQKLFFLLKMERKCYMYFFPFTVFI